MNKAEWEKLFRQAIRSLQQQTFVPYDTGNLKYGAIKGIWKDDNTFTIYIDEKIAPYVFFTNEPWGRSSKYYENLGYDKSIKVKTGKRMNKKPIKHGYGRNPNEGWIDKMVEYIADYICKRLKGVKDKR